MMTFVCTQVLPFASVKAFYDEYTASSLHQHGCDEMSSVSTFTRAYKEISESGKNCRLMRGKGNFSTCGTCNAAAALLANKSKHLHPDVRKMIIRFRYERVERFHV